MMPRFAAWDWDVSTLLWTLWIAWFFVQESIEIVARNEPLTDHLRPVFQVHELTWFLALGLWLWVGWHFLVQGIWVD